MQWMHRIKMLAAVTPALVMVLSGVPLAYSAEKPAADASASTSAAPPQLGKQISDFELRDYRGKQRSLAEWSEAPLVVVTFLGTECPLAKLYAPRLEELQQRYADAGVVFIGINSNVQDSNSEVAAHAQRHGITFPVLKDPGNVVADQFAAIRTPEVFVLDADRKVRYWGRIDDQYGVGYQRPQANREDLAEAIDQLLAGEDVRVAVTEAPGCYIGRVRETAATDEVTYSAHIAQIFQDRCVECHRPGQIAPFPMQTYDDVAGWAETIKEVIEDQRMPPWHADPQHGTFSNDARLSDEEKSLIFRWVKSGAPEGDPADLPAPREFADGWLMGQPDVVFTMPEAFEVPAEGTIDYKYFVIDPGFTEDKWVQAAECLPGCHAVVHHIIVFVKPPGQPMRGHGGLSGFFAATAPGAPPLVMLPGMAKKVPAGSKFVFQMHYTPNGSKQLDQSSLGLKFVDASEVKHEVHTLSAANPFFLIPPHHPNYEVTAYKTMREDTLLLALYPHMHLRGKAFRYVAEYLDGTEEILLDVPKYDFNWQNSYIFAEPRLLPKGTKLRAIAHFDNSEDNLWNPDPNKEVYFGEQTWDEMMIGFFDATPVRQVDHSENLAKQPEEDAPRQGRQATRSGRSRNR